MFKRCPRACGDTRKAGAELHKPRRGAEASGVERARALRRDPHVGSPWCADAYDTDRACEQACQKWPAPLTNAATPSIGSRPGSGHDSGHLIGPQARRGPRITRCPDEARRGRRGIGGGAARSPIAAQLNRSSGGRVWRGEATPSRKRAGRRPNAISAPGSAATRMRRRCGGAGRRISRNLVTAAHNATRKRNSLGR